VVRVSPDALEVDDALANRDPVLAQLAAAAVAGLPAPAGPRACHTCPCPTRLRRARRPLALPSANASHWPWSPVAGLRSSAIWWCKTAVSTYTRKHAPVPSTTKPAPAFCATSCAHASLLAQDRLAVLPDHRVRLTLKRPWSDGTYALDMDALALLARLASAVPPPKQHLTRYSGVLAAAAHWRPLIIPPAPVDSSASAAPAPPPTSTPAQPAFTKPQRPPPSGRRCRYIRWAELMRLTFGLTVDQCPACRGDSPRKSVAGGPGRMKLRALVRDPESIERFLRHQDLWSPPQDTAPARAPPYHRKVTRLSPTRQQEIFPES
jgi:hypothetical protein